MTDLNLACYNVTYVHTNHSVFTKKIKAFSALNLQTQIESLLFNRYRRHIPWHKAKVCEITEEQFSGDYIKE